jgi:hypothetical protein
VTKTLNDKAVSSCYPIGADFLQQAVVVLEAKWDFCACTSQDKQKKGWIIHTA